MRPIILVSIAHYLPGWKFGGPTTTISNMVSAFGEEFDFRIFTSDRDFGDKLPYPDIQLNRWQSFGASQIFYASRDTLNFQGIVHVLLGVPYDILYLNSFFRPEFTTVPLIARRLGMLPDRPCVLAPRGEFAPAALSIKSRKKKAFLAISRALSLHRNIRWQASSDFEAADVHRVMRPAAGNVLVAANLPRRAIAAENVEAATLSNGQPFRVVSMARISMMKNIHFALDVLKGSAVPIQFDLWGSIEDQSYWAFCKTLIKEMPPHVQVTYRGEAQRGEIDRLLGCYDLMFMPSLGENFGQSIAEAIANGLPVLISDRTPWRNLPMADVGWDLPIDQGADAFRAALSSAYERCQADRAGWRASVLKYAAANLFKADVLAANRRLFAL